MDSNSLLMVEGRDDECVLKALLEIHQIPECFQIKSYGGINQVLDLLPIEIKAKENGQVGVVVDANSDIDSRWNSIKNILQKAGYNSIPDTPHNNGTIVIPQSNEVLPTFGAWIMPNNHLSGILETFLQFLVPPGDLLLTYAIQCVKDLPGNPHFSLEKLPKAEIYTWLAWQDDPGAPVGQAITKRYLKPDCKSADKLMDWLKRLFDDA
ncbi:MAG: hypothetical protein C4527_06950 [Candidatus Omnitrophota bacterium]|jgi:hypothetical protein|nr:MAG: hypothetical protein C4527_06950 [Candidatus Omnitrophota bacterium]